MDIAMRSILLQNKGFTIVDDEDFEAVKGIKWFKTNISGNQHTHYIYGNIRLSKYNYKVIQLHTLLMKTPKGMMVDHRNGHGWDNRRKSNLRICSASENAYNSRKRDNATSDYKGVFWNTLRQRWGCIATRKHYGYFDMEVDAAVRYDEVARRLHGKFAALNFPRPGERGCLKVNYKPKWIRQVEEENIINAFIDDGIYCNDKSIY